MDVNVVSNIIDACIHRPILHAKRCEVGIGNQVYIVECDNAKYILRCSEDNNAYADTIHWLTELSTLDLPIPKVLFHGRYERYSYLILNYIEGEDIGLVYPRLSKSEKQRIAKDVIAVQRKVAHLPLNHIDSSWSWYDFLNDMLDRADERIARNGHFDINKVAQLRMQMHHLHDYFSAVKPVAYLDDISTKNLLIHNGELSGIIDIDWMGVGDSLTFIAMTYVALLNMNCETDYVDYLLEESHCSDEALTAFLFYSLLYCVDFMGERGMQFGDKQIAVSDEIVERLNRIYDMLWDRWCAKMSR